MSKRNKRNKRSTSDKIENAVNRVLRAFKGKGIELALDQTSGGSTLKLEHRDSTMLASIANRIGVEIRPFAKVKESGLKTPGVYEMQFTW